MGFTIASDSVLSVGANSKSADRVAGTFQFLPRTGILSLYARPSATGMKVTLVVGGEIVTNDQDMACTGTAGALSKADHLIGSVPVARGARVELYFRNTTGGAVTVDDILELDPLA